MISPLTLGMFAMIALGVAAGAVALWVFSRHSTLGQTLPPAIFATVLLGVGTFGPSFLSDFGDFLGKLKDSSGNWNVRQVDVALDQIAKGSRDPAEAKAIIALLKEDPPPNFERMLESAAALATNESGRELLTDTRIEHERFLRTVERLADSDAADPSPPLDAANLDLRTRRALEDVLPRLPAERRDRILFPPDLRRERP